MAFSFASGFSLASTAFERLRAHKMPELLARLRHMDIAGMLVGFADAIEDGITVLRRLFRGRLLRARSGRLGFGLLWRGLAALTGICLTATLVTALSSSENTPRLAVLSEQPGETPPVRDVRQVPLALAGTSESWIRINKPIALFGLTSPELENQPVSYEARRSEDGRNREDVLAFGAFGEARPHLLLRLLSERGPLPLPQPFIIGLVRDTAARGLGVQRSGVAAGLETRFGLVETADVTLSDGDSSRACVGFRYQGSEAPLSFGGWWCGGANRPADRQQLVCMIDRIDLLSAGDDRALRAAFASTELKRHPGCAPSRLSATGRKASWLDADGTAPALRTKSAAAGERGKSNTRQ